MTPQIPGRSRNSHLGDLMRVTRPMGLGRALQKAGYGTRKVAEAIVVSGRVRVDGRLQTDPKAMVQADSKISLDNQALRVALATYLVLNKPSRVVCAPLEGETGLLVSDFYPKDIPGLRPVGRMDGRNTGLLLVSNDKDWNGAVTDSVHLEHEYRVQVDGVLSELEVSVISAGINLPKMGQFKPLSVRIVEIMNGRTVLNIVLTDGKVRQLRRMFTTLRHRIFYLRRIRIGDVRLENLPPGQWRDLTEREVESIKAFSSPPKK